MMPFSLLSALAVVLLVGCSKSVRLEKALERAERSFEAGDYEAAEIEFLNVLRLGPSNVLALNRLGSIYFDQGRSLQAYVTLSRASELDPENPTIRLKLGVTQQAAGAYEKAREAALFVLSKQPTNDTAFLLLADSTPTTNDLADSFQRLEELRSQAEARPGFHLAWGALYVRSRNLDRAKAEITKAVELDPSFPDAQAALGNLYLLENNRQDADVHLKRAADLDDNSRSVRKLAYAQFKLQTGEVEEGKRLLEEVLGNAPDFFPAWIRLAEQGLTERQYDECRKRVDEILRRDAENYDAKVLLGRLHLAQGKPEEALAELEQLSRMFPDTPGLHYYLGLAQSLKGDSAAALASLTRAIQLDPAFGDAVLLKAELDIRNADYLSAATALRQFIAEHQVSERALALQVEAYRRLGKADDALQICNQWMRLAPGNPEVPLLAGRVLVGQKKTALAREAFEKALKIKPDNFMALEELVNLDLSAGDYEAATRRAKTLLSEYPQSPAPLVMLAKIHDAQRQVRRGGGLPQRGHQPGTGGLHRLLDPRGRPEPLGTSHASHRNPPEVS